MVGKWLIIPNDVINTCVWHVFTSQVFFMSMDLYITKLPAFMYVNVLGAPGLEVSDSGTGVIDGFKSPCGLLIMKVRSATRTTMCSWSLYLLSSSNLTGFKNANPGCNLKHPKNCSNFLCKVTFLISNTKLSEVYLWIWCSCVTVPCSSFHSPLLPEPAYASFPSLLHGV